MKRGYQRREQSVSGKTKLNSCTVGLNDPPDRALTQCGTPIYKDSFSLSRSACLTSCVSGPEGLGNHFPEMGLVPASGRSQTDVEEFKSNLIPHASYNSALLQSDLDLAVFSRPSHERGFQRKDQAVSNPHTQHFL